MTFRMQNHWPGEMGISHQQIQRRRRGGLSSALGDSISISTYTLLHCKNLDWTLTVLEKSHYSMLSTISFPDCVSSLILCVSLSMKSKSKWSTSVLGEKAENGDCKGLLGHLRVSGHLILGKDEGLFGLLDPEDEGLLGDKDASWTLTDWMKFSINRL